MSIARKPARGALLTVGVLMAAVGIAGCSNNQPPTPPATTVNVPPPAPGTTTTTTNNSAPAPGSGGPMTKINNNAGPGTSQGTNSAVADAVNKAIVTNKEMTGSRVDVVVDSAGVATLTGAVQDAQQKALAVKAARNTPGVTSVTDKLQVSPTGGAKAAAKPMKTKVVVVHEKTVVSPPASSGAMPAGPTEAPNPTPGSAMNNSGGASSNGMPGNPPAAGNNPPGSLPPATNGNGQ